MELEEYLKTSYDHSEELADHPEFDHFVKVWVHTRQPNLIAELRANFDAIYPQLYAHWECQAAKTRNEEFEWT